MKVIYKTLKGYVRAEISDKPVEVGLCIGRFVTYEEDNKIINSFIMGGYLTKDDLSKKITELQNDIDFLKFNSDWINEKEN